MINKLSVFLAKFYLFLSIILLSGCSALVVLNPQGQIGASEKDLIITAALLMLIVVIPAIGMTFFFAWKYRASNNKNDYQPDWYSKKIEIGVWIIPALITCIIAVLTWYASHKLDPYQPLKSNVKPLEIQVVSLDWKWLFIYPQQNIATVNEMVIPAGVPIHFLITSDNFMNSFFIPQLGSQIMTMPGMQTQLYLIANAGQYQGISANFSGPGFTGMSFSVTSTSQQAFQTWVNTVKQATNTIDYASYQTLAKPSSNNPVEYFSAVQPNLFNTIVNRYMDSKM